MFTTINQMTNIISEKPKLYSTILIRSEFQVRAIIRVYERGILLNANEVNISQLQLLHCYNTILNETEKATVT